MSENLVQIGSLRRLRRRPGTPPAPGWLRIKLATPAKYHEVRKLVDGLNLNTVCKEAKCPNIYECWGEHGTATFMILGEICTRRCGFCAVTSGRPNPGVDAAEPGNVAAAVATMGLRHAVITSVDRDDLPDGGARHWAAVIRAIHERHPACAVEVLTPDFRGVPDALDIVLAAAPEVFSHNTETVPRLYRQARPGSRYDRTLALLAEASRRRDEGSYAGPGQDRHHARPRRDRRRSPRHARRHPRRGRRGADARAVPAADAEASAGRPLRAARTSSPAHKAFAMELGFLHCEAGPLVRSSYHAHEHVPPELRAPAAR